MGHIATDDDVHDKQVPSSENEQIAEAVASRLVEPGIWKEA